MKDSFGVDAELFAEGNGIFDVVVDGDLVYSKFDTGRFPEDNEVSKLIKEKAS